MTDKHKPGVSVVLVARNEAGRLPGWFTHVQWVDEIIVIDSGSTDQTAAIARDHRARVVMVPNKLNFDLNKNTGFAEAAHEWIFALDADEIPDDTLIAAVQAVVADAACPYAAFTIRRRNLVMGRDTGTADHMVRLFRNGAAHLPGDTVHQAMRVTGTVGRLPGEILHHTDASFFERVEKSNTYSECMAAYWYGQRKPFRLWDLCVQPAIHFFKKYFVRRGYRLGVLGFIDAVNGAYSVFLRYAKLWSAYDQGEFLSPSDDFPPLVEQGSREPPQDNP
ncbi:MAG: glycosyltransferase family 2 protein [Anaerolineae bacterium]|nr:glycosyltransferase family 2 protein [Anaerolineae bacterium]